MKHFKRFFLFLNITTNLFSISYPVAPKEPIVSGEEKKEKEKKTVLVQVKLKLGSGDEWEGLVDFPPKVSFPHYRNGLSFHKTLAIEEIKKIQILSYEERAAKANLFEFEPEECLVVTQKGLEFKINGIFPFLRKITIETEYGKTTLYTIFADTWNEKTGWQEVSSKDRHYHRKKPHPKAVQEIEILSLPSLQETNKTGSF